jgi:hypothetical protein
VFQSPFIGSTSKDKSLAHFKTYAMCVSVAFHRLYI